MRRTSLKDMIKPRRVEVESKTLDDKYGKFVAEPLERGFGLTLGNALRRILLSSLQGCAITSVRIDGVMHEFSTIDNVKEDVTQIVLNLKDVVFIMEDKSQATGRIEVSGPCELTAGMIQGDGFTVVNPDLLIATLGDGVTFKADLTIKKGRGYVTSEQNKEEDAPIGTIFLDSIFSPIRKVNHVVTNARVGQRTDYDKLTMEIWTDGSIDPRTAVAEASHILRDQLSIFVGDYIVEEVHEEEKEEPKEQFNPNLFRRIEEIELSVRSANCLENADIKFIGELVQRTEAEMLRTKNFGRKSLNEIKDILSKMGLSLGMKLENFPSREELEARAREVALDDGL
ncbi:MAG: DNA-directed RNA polymerase subunit alpha [Candidatus Dadabacteria bacterium]|nr:MAG: DNA-directed RNA polymerase subunit alpha [Candidatus Dadabacteria bacterium]